MKPTLFAAALFGAGAACAAPPVITITTPAQFNASKAIITGSATDTEESTGGTGSGGTGATVRGPGGVREVLFQYEGESKWRKTTLTAKGELTTTWIAEVSLKAGSTKRILFMAVDKGGNDGAVVGRKFKRLKTGETGSDGGSTGNQPPTFTVADKESSIGATINTDLRTGASDPNGDTFTFTGSGLPAGLTITDGRYITGKITETAAVERTVTLTASDGKTGGATVKTFKWKINVNKPPTIDSIGNRTTSVNQAPGFSAVGRDPDGDALTYDYQVMSSGGELPPGVKFGHDTGLFGGTVLGGLGVYEIRVKVIDPISNGSASTTFTWTIN